MRRCHRHSRRALFFPASLLVLFSLVCHANASSVPRYIAAQGRVVAEQGIVTPGIYAESGTPVIAVLNVQEGQRVRQGDILATLATKDFLHASLREALAREAAAHDEAAAAQARITAAQARAQAAQADVQLATDGIAEARAAVELADKSLVEAIAQYEAQQARLSGTWAENKRILDKDSPPAREAAQIRFEQKMLDLQKQELAASAAATELRLQAQIDQAQAAVQTAQSRLVLAGVQVLAAEAEIAAAAAVAAAANDAAEAAAHAVTRAKWVEDTAIVRAPISGTVLKLNAIVGETVPQEGLLQMADLGNLRVEAEVYIDDLRDVKIGQKARMSGEAFAGEIHGTVERIGQIVELPEIFTRDPAAFTDRRVVKVRIRLDGTPAQTAPGTAGQTTSVANATAPGTTAPATGSATNAAAQPAASGANAATGTVANGSATATLPSPLPINARVLVRIER